MERYINTEGARIYVSDFVCEQMKKIPTANVAEVVKCEKCKHWHKSSIEGILGDVIGYCHNNDFPFNCEHRPCMKSTDFCSYGERRDT